MAAKKRKTPTKKVCWDSNAFLSYIEGTESRIDDLRAVFIEGINKEIAIIASSICITEVAFTAAERTNGLSKEVEREIAKLWAPGSPIQLIEYSSLIARHAQRLLRAKCDKGWHLKCMDAIHIATAVQQRAEELHTFDKRLWAWSEYTGIAIKKPEPHQMLLPGNANGE